MNPATSPSLAQAVEAAFKERKERIGDYWAYDMGITENNLEAFVQDVLDRMGVKVADIAVDTSKKLAPSD